METSQMCQVQPRRIILTVLLYFGPQYVQATTANL